MLLKVANIKYLCVVIQKELGVKNVKFSYQFDFYFPLSQNMVMNSAQRKIKIKFVWKNFKPKKKNRKLPQHVHDKIAKQLSAHYYIAVVSIKLDANA